MINVMFEVVEQFVGVGVTPVEVPGERAMEDLVEPFVDAGVERTKVRDGQLEDVAAGFLGVGPFENVPGEKQIPEHHAGGEQPLVAHHAFADRICVVEIAAGDVDHRGLADAAHFQGAEVGPLDGGGRIYCREFDHRRQVDTEAEELRHGGEEVESWTFDRDHMHVRGDHVGQEARADGPRLPAGEVARDDRAR